LFRLEIETGFMNAKAPAANPNLKPAVYLGATVTVVIALLPYVNDFFITAYVAGAFAAVWFAIRKGRRLLAFKDGAQLGFLSGFYGLLAASTVYDVIWQFFHYQLWQIQNADRILAIFADMVHDAFSLSAWIVITFQIVASAIFAGAFGAPSGILAVKIFQQRPGTEDSR
jgi:hypothetical protein